MTEYIDADTVNRTALLTMHNQRAATIEDAVSAHRNSRIAIATDLSTVQTREGQAALLTAAKTGARAFGNVYIAVSEDVTILGGPDRGHSLVAQLTTEGVTVAATLDGIDADVPTILLDTAQAAERQGPTVRATWSGWTAAVTPGHGPVEPSSGNILAAIAAGALAINEAFDQVHFPVTPAFERTTQLNLWDTGNGTGLEEPNLEWAPPAWWLVGLGHLGQAYTWVISWLAYENPASVNVVLQDTGLTSIANHSTGVLTPQGSEGRRKTRQAAEALETSGFTDTTIIERRLDAHTRVADDERYHVALIGVDDTEPRRFLTGVGWAFVVDAGLGTGVNDFDSIAVHTFTSEDDSSSVVAWRGDRAPVVVPAAPAFTDLSARFDQCGVIEVAGKAIGASFVGVLAAVLAVAEPIRVLHGGDSVDRLRFDPRPAEFVSAPRQGGSISHILAAKLAR